MILSFKTHHNGRPTHFVEKIWESFCHIPAAYNSAAFDTLFDACESKGIMLNCPFFSKAHSIRIDQHNRWKPGTIIDFFINARQKDMFRFAPRIPVVSVQQIQIVYEKADLSHIARVKVYIDGNLFYSESDVRIPSSSEEYREMMQLAINDGFHNIADFFSWFNKDFTGKIIHWSDLKY